MTDSTDRPVGARLRRPERRVVTALLPPAVADALGAAALHDGCSVSDAARLIAEGLRAARSAA